MIYQILLVQLGKQGSFTGSGERDSFGIKPFQNILDSIEMTALQGAVQEKKRAMDFGQGRPYNKAMKGRMFFLLPTARRKTGKAFPDRTIVMQRGILPVA